MNQLRQKLQINNPGAISRSAVAQIKLQTGTYSSEGEIFDNAYRDTEVIDSTILTYNFFVNGPNRQFQLAAAGNKTRADTNYVGGELPNNQNFEIKAIKGFYKPYAAKTEAQWENLVNFLENGELNFKIDGKDTLLNISLQELFAINLPQVITPAVAGDNSRTQATNIIKSAYPLNISIPIAAQTTWQIEVRSWITPSTDLDNDKLMLVCQGPLQRLS